MKSFSAARAALLAFTVIGATASTSAIAEVYTTRAAFDAATTGRTVIDFNSQTGSNYQGYGSAYSSDRVTFSDSNVFIIGPSYIGASAGARYGSSYLEWQGGSQSNLVVTLSGISTAAAFDFMEFNGYSTPFLIAVNGETFSYTTGLNPSFFGYSSAAPIASLTISMTNTSG